MKKNKIKQALALLCSVTMVMGLTVGCASGTETTSVSESAAETPTEAASETPADTAEEEAPADVTIQIFQSKVEIVEQVDAMAAEYTELTGVKVESLGSGAADSYNDLLMAKFNSGQAPTVISISPGETLNRLNSYLYDLSDQPYVSDIAENQALVYDGKILGIPYGVEGYGLVYNKNLVDPSKMTDLNSFTAYAQELKASGIDAVEMSDAAYFLVAHILNVPFAMQPDYMDYLDKLGKGEVKMAETPEFQEWAKIMEVIRANGENPMGITYDDQAANFATGKTAMIHQGNWVWGMFTDYGIEFDMGIAPVPVMGNDKISVGMPNAWCITKDNEQAEIDEALKFFEWFFTSERGHHYITNEFKFIPALKSIPADSLDPLSQVVHEYTNSGKTLVWANNDWPTGIVNTHIFPIAQKFFSDTSITGQQLLEELDKAWVEGVAAIAQ